MDVNISLMEPFRDILTLLLGIILLTYPLLFIPFLRKITDAMIFVVVTAMFSGILCLILFWWDDFSTWELMEYYGWNSDGMSDLEYFQNVADCDRERVQKLWNHNMGVGWPVKAFFCYIVILPFQWLLSVVEYLIVRYIRSKDLIG